MAESVKCERCERVRQEDDEDYHFMQAIQGLPFGWYSGDDGEFCGPCLRFYMGVGNG